MVDLTRWSFWERDHLGKETSNVSIINISLWLVNFHTFNWGRSWVACWKASRGAQCSMCKLTLHPLFPKELHLHPPLCRCSSVNNLMVQHLQKLNQHVWVRRRTVSWLHEVKERIWVSDSSYTGF